MQDEAKRSSKDIAGWIVTIIICAICAMLVFVRFRYDARYVETGSMRPEYDIGAIVLVDDKAYDDADPKVGDVAVYQSGNRQVMHRIVDIDENGDYIFEGDNNQSTDFAPVERQQIVGKAVTHFNFVAPLVRKIRHLSNI